MNFIPLLNFINSKAFKWIGTALIFLFVAYFLWDKIETVATNNTTLRSNISELKKQNETLESNLQKQKLEYEDKLKAQKFNSKVEVKKIEVKEVIKKYKKNGVKNDKVSNDTVIYYPL